MQLALDYPDRAALADAVQLHRLKPGESFSVKTVSNGQRNLVFVNYQLDAIVTHTVDGKRASVDLKTLTLTVHSSLRGR